MPEIHRPSLCCYCCVMLCVFWNSFIDLKDLWEPISTHDDHLLLFQKEAKIEIFFAFLIILHHAWRFALSNHGLVYPWTSIMVYMYISVFLFCFRGSINFLLLIFLGQLICTLSNFSYLCDVSMNCDFSNLCFHIFSLLSFRPSNFSVCILYNWVILPYVNRT